MKNSEEQHAEGTGEWDTGLPNNLLKFETILQDNMQTAETHWHWGDMFQEHNAFNATHKMPRCKPTWHHMLIFVIKLGTAYIADMTSKILKSAIQNVWQTSENMNSWKLLRLDSPLVGKYLDFHIMFSGRCLSLEHVNHFPIRVLLVMVLDGCRDLIGKELSWWKILVATAGITRLTFQ